MLNQVKNLNQINLCILDTVSLDNVLILQEEVTCKTVMEVKGLNASIESNFFKSGLNSLIGLFSLSNLCSVSQLRKP